MIRNSASSKHGFADLFDTVGRVLELTDLADMEGFGPVSSLQPSSWLTDILPSIPPAFLSPPTKPQNQSGKWNERYQELVKFQQEHGHCSVPSQFPSNPPLAQWVKRQRYQRKIFKEGQHSTMTEERKILLDNLGFIWDSHSSFWEDRFQELTAFKEKHGHANVPTKYPENLQLAIWAKCQRRQFKIFRTEGPKQSNMTLDRINKLTTIGFVFNPREFKRQLANKRQRA